MIAVWALGCYVAAIVVWNVVLKRNIGEALVIGFVVTGLFAGGGIGSVMWDAFREAMQEEVTFAALAFVFMSYLLARTPVLDQLLGILNSMLGRLRGGPVYTSTVAAAAFGAIAHVEAAVAGGVGAVTIPWMKRSKMSGELAATVAAGCAGMGVSFPFSSTMFILVGSAGVASLVTTEQVALPLVFAGLWCLAYRLVVAFLLIRRHKVEPMDPADVRPLRTSFGAGWTSLLLFVAIAVPLLMTQGPASVALGHWTGGKMSTTTSLITWIPVLLIATVLVLGRRHLPRSAGGWWQTLGDSAPRFGVLGVTIVAAFSASNVLVKLELAHQLTQVLAGARAPLWGMALLVGVLVMAVAQPLTATATMAAVGPVAVASLVGAGLDPATACAVTLVFVSANGASPFGPPLYVAAGIAGVAPSGAFRPLIAYYSIPILFLGTAIAVGILPI